MSNLNELARRAEEDVREVYRTEHSFPEPVRGKDTPVPEIMSRVPGISGTPREPAPMREKRGPLGG